MHKFTILTLYTLFHLTQMSAQELSKIRDERFYWNENTEEWEPESRTHYTPTDNYGGTIDSLYIKLDGEWLLVNVKEKRNISTGDYYLNRDESYYYEDRKLVWVEFTRSIRTFDENQNTLAGFEINGNHDALSQHTEFFNCQKFQFLNNSNGCIEESYYHTVEYQLFESSAWDIDPEALAWKKTTDYEIERDADCRQLLRSSRSYAEDGTLEHRNKWEHVYDEQGNKTAYRVFYWDDIQEDWRLSLEVTTLYEYNAENHLISSEIFRNGVVQERNFYTYTSGGLLSTDQQTTYDNDEQVWLLTRLDSFIYNGNGQVTESFESIYYPSSFSYYETINEFEYTPEGWVAQHKVHSTLERFEELLRDNIQTWDYSYDCAGNVTEYDYLIEREFDPCFSERPRYLSKTKCYYRGSPFCDEPFPKGNQLEVYPNPSPGIVFIKSPLLDTASASIHVYDLQGREVFADQTQQLSGQYILFLESVPAFGTYQVVVQTASDRESSLVVIGR